MRERDRQELRKFSEQYEAEEKAAKEERERPLKTAEAQLQKTASELLATERRIVLNGRDDEIQSLVSEPMKTAKWLGEEETIRANDKAIREFIAATPTYYECPENGEAIVGYMARNGIRLIDLPTLTAIYHRLDSLGFLKHAPAPKQPEPEPIIEQPAQPEPVTDGFAGIDPRTGETRIYTRREVEAMTADEYKRAFRLPSKWQIEYEETGAGKWPVK